MKVTTVVLFLGGAALLSGSQNLGQDPKGKQGKTALSARIEVDAHKHCFTVRFFLKNNGKEEEKVVYGRGSSGLQVVPQFQVEGVTITPPTYLRPPRRAMSPNSLSIPAKKEILYGTFTMGYPQLEKAKDTQLTATIYFRELKATVRTKPQTLKIPAQKPLK